MWTVITDEKDAKIIRQLASKEHHYAVNAMWAHPELRRELLMKVQGEIENECQILCSNKKPSLFRESSPQDLIYFSENKCETELKEKAPIFHKCLQAATTCKEPRKNRSAMQTCLAYEYPGPRGFSCLFTALVLSSYAEKNQENPL